MNNLKVFIIWIILIFSACQTKKNGLIKFEGNTMGTTYHISYLSNKNNLLQKEIDSLLVDFSNSLSTYIPSSTISGANGEDTLFEVDEYFAKVFMKSQEVSEKTDGAFDVSVMPLVNLWGFGTKKDTVVPNKREIDSVLRFVGYNKVSLTNDDGKYFFHKNNSKVQVTFNAIAQGYCVDLIAEFLESKGKENYLVEIGGEVRTKGKNQDGEWWKIGIDKPIDDSDPENRELKAILQLQNQSLNTSGNYRNFYYNKGNKYSHEIDPQKGYPVRNNLLSVSVVAKDCMSADAYATAFMVMGYEKSMGFMQKDSMMDAYFIYVDSSGKMKTAMTEGVKKLLVEEEK